MNGVRKLAMSHETNHILDLFYVNIMTSDHVGFMLEYYLKSVHVSILHLELLCSLKHDCFGDCL